MWGWSYLSDTSPGYGNIGVAVTPVENAMGNWVQLVTTGNCAHDVYRVVLRFSKCWEISTYDKNKSYLFDLGVDEAGGTSYTVRGQFMVTRSVGDVGYVDQGWKYDLPLFVKASSTIAVRCQTAINQLTDVYAAVEIYGRPLDRSRLRYGMYCESMGVDTTNSRGTAVTPEDNAYSGGPNAGQWTQIGSTLTKELHSLIMNVGYSATTNTNSRILGSLSFGDASNKQVMLQNGIWKVSDGQLMVQGYPEVLRTIAPSGSNIYAQLSNSNIPAGVFSVTAHGFFGGSY